MSANVGKLCCGKTMYKHQLRRHIVIGLMRITSMCYFMTGMSCFFYKISIYGESVFCAKRAFDFNYSFMKS